MPAARPSARRRARGPARRSSRPAARRAGRGPSAARRAAPARRRACARPPARSASATGRCCAGGGSWPGSRRRPFARGRRSRACGRRGRARGWRGGPASACRRRGARARGASRGGRRAGAARRARRRARAATASRAGARAGRACGGRRATRRPRRDRCARARTGALRRRAATSSSPTRRWAASPGARPWARGSRRPRQRRGSRARRRWRGREGAGDVSCSLQRRHAWRRRATLGGGLRHPGRALPLCILAAVRRGARSEGGDWLALAVVLVGAFMAILDVAIVNVAIPSIRADLHTSFGAVELVITGYTITYACLLVTGGRLGDILGRRRMFIAGILVFTAASAVCGVAPSVGVLVAARAVQGIGGALLYPQVLSIIQVTFSGEQRGP